MSKRPPWWEESRRKQNNRDSKTQELRRARQVGGRVQAGSGSSWRAPNDVMTGDALEELKFTQKDSYRIRVVDWLRHRGNARRAGVEPTLIIDFPTHRIRLVVREEPYP